MDLMIQILQQAPVYISAVIVALSGIISVCLLIPGDQPEKALQGVVDFLTKFSKK